MKKGTERVEDFEDGSFTDLNDTSMRQLLKQAQQKKEALSKSEAAPIHKGVTFPQIGPSATFARNDG